MSNQNGILYVVATPIGNLGDISYRAIDVLNKVDLIAAEDTRHSRKLLTHYGINKRLVSCHEHNEQQKASVLIGSLKKGDSIALLSDAGTPLVSDPGYRVVSAALEEGIQVVPIPGPCAAIAALSVAGLPTDHFLFVGFPSSKQVARRAQFESLAQESATLIFYESPRRLLAALEDAQIVMGPERHTVVARELTKLHEVVVRGRLQDVIATVSQDSNWQKGELVLMFAGQAQQVVENKDILEVLKPLLEELPVKQAAKLTAKITGARKNEVYDLAIKLSADQ